MLEKWCWSIVFTVFMLINYVLIVNTAYAIFWSILSKSRIFLWYIDDPILLTVWGKRCFLLPGGFRPDRGMTDVFAEKRQPAGIAHSFYGKGFCSDVFQTTEELICRACPRHGRGIISRLPQQEKRQRIQKIFFTEDSGSIPYGKIKKHPIDSW